MRCARCERFPAAPARHWCARCLEGQRSHRRRVRMEVIAMYGGACVCCGERGQRFLTVACDGNAGFARADFNQHTTRWRTLRALGVPQDGLRCLCFNCLNAIVAYGDCTHPVVPGRTQEIPSAVNGTSLSAKHGGQAVVPR